MENAIVGERSQAQKATHLFEMSRIGHFLEKNLALAEGW